LPPLECDGYAPTRRSTHPSDASFVWSFDENLQSATDQSAHIGIRRFSLYFQQARFSLHHDRRSHCPRQLGGSRATPPAKRKDMHLHESDFSDHVAGGLKIGLRLTREADNDVGGKRRPIQGGAQTPAPLQKACRAITPPHE